MYQKAALELFGNRASFRIEAISDDCPKFQIVYKQSESEKWQTLTQKDIDKLMSAHSLYVLEEQALSTSKGLDSPMLFPRYSQADDFVNDILAVLDAPLQSVKTLKVFPNS